MENVLKFHVTSQATGLMFGLSSSKWLSFKPADSSSGISGIFSSVIPFKTTPLTVTHSEFQKMTF